MKRAGWDRALAKIAYGDLHFRPIDAIIVAVPT